MQAFRALSDNLFAWIGGYRAPRAARSSKQILGNPRDPVLARWFGGGNVSEAGFDVTAESAWGLPAFYRGISLRAHALASMPFPFYRREGERDRVRDRDHWLYDLLNTRPNDWQTAQEFWYMMLVHLQLRGDGYAAAGENNSGVVENLVPLHPDRVRAFWVYDTTGRRLPGYEYTPDRGKKVIYLSGEILHLRHDSEDGLTGRSLVQVHRETLGRDMATRANSSRFMKNDTSARAWIKYPGKFEDNEARRKFREEWQAANAGVNRGQFPILERNMSLEALGVSAEDAGFLEAMNFNVLDASRITGVPPHKLGHLQDATFSNLEQENLSWVQEGLMPFATIMEQTVARDLMTAALRKTHFAEVDLRSLLRGDSKARADFYNRLFMMASMAPNEIRRAENMNSIGPEGDRYFVQGAMVPLDRIDQVLDRNQGSVADRLKRMLQEGVSEEDLELARRVIGYAPSNGGLTNGGVNGHGE